MQPSQLESVVRLWHETCVDTYDFIPIERDRGLADRRSFFNARIAPERELWVALEKEQLVGFLALKRSYIDRLYVLPRSQRRGTGEALIEKARERSPTGLELHTHQKNTKARCFYEKSGFHAARFGVSAPPESEPDVEYHWRPARVTPPGREWPGLRAGASITEEPADQFYGDRRYAALDPEGHVWFFAQHIRDVAPEDMKPPQ